MGTQPIDFHFKLVDFKTYTMVLTMTAKNRLINKIFQSVSKKYKKRKGIDIGEALEKTDKFDIPEKYHYLVRVTSNKAVSDIINQIKKDKIKVMTHNIDKARFTRTESKDWFIEIYIGGEYIDERE